MLHTQFAQGKLIEKWNAQKLAPKQAVIIINKFNGIDDDPEASTPPLTKTTAKQTDINRYIATAKRRYSQCCLGSTTQRTRPVKSLIRPRELC